MGNLPARTPTPLGVFPAYRAVVKLHKTIAFRLDVSLKVFACAGKSDMSEKSRALLLQTGSGLYGNITSVLTLVISYRKQTHY